MNDANSRQKLWSGRFTESTDAAVERFTASVELDRRLAPYDIQGSIAHSNMLADAGVITAAERDVIVSGLEAIAADIAAGNFEWSDALEDVHMNVEAALTDRVGDVGKKLHTGRSRNDQVATDMRLMAREEIDAIGDCLRLTQIAIVDLAEQEAETIMPGPGR